MAAAAGGCGSASTDQCLAGANRRAQYSAAEDDASVLGSGEESGVSQAGVE